MKNRSNLTIFTTILSVLACIGLLPQMQAAPDVVPAPDGCYPGFTTAEGCNALRHLTSGAGNTGVGWYSLFANTTGSYNTGFGAGTLVLNTAVDNTAVGAAALLLNTSGTGGTAVGTVAPDESGTIRIGDISNGNGAGSLACFIGGIFNNFQPVGGSVVEVTLNLNTDELGWDIGPSQRGSAPAAPRSAPGRRNKPQSGARPAVPQRQAFNDKVEKLQAVVQLQQKQIVALTVQLKEQAAQIQKVSAQVEVSKPAPRVVTNKP